LGGWRVERGNRYSVIQHFFDAEQDEHSVGEEWIGDILKKSAFCFVLVEQIGL
jgi:hypothetical protein